MKKILFVLMACVLCIGLVGGAFAYFTDTQASTGNTFTSGVAVIAISNNDVDYKAVNNVVIGTASNMAPGQEVGPFLACFKNVGTVSGVVTVDIDYAAATGLPAAPAGAPGDISTATIDQFASKLIVTHAESDHTPGHNIADYWARQIAEDTGLGTWADAVSNGYIVAATTGLTYNYLPTILGLKQVTLHFWDSYKGDDVPLADGQRHWEKMKLALDSSADNTYAWTGIEIIVNATITSN
ncbi:MAG: hypothetical protein JW762_05675 [Dehalococcoidales bacterium]|nr:hypothetical protein [Dehalococcoidales bacterium]